MIGVIKNRMATLRLPIASEDIAGGGGGPAKQRRDFTRHDTIVPDSRWLEYLHGTYKIQNPPKHMEDQSTNLLFSSLNLVRPKEELVRCYRIAIVIGLRL